MPNMKQHVRTRWQGTVDYQAGSTRTFNLGRGMIYREIYLRLSGAITDSNPGFQRTDIEAGDEWAAVERIELVANGTQVLFSISGEQLQWLNYFQLQCPRKLSTNLAQAADSTDAQTFDSTLILPLWMPQSRKPIDTMLNSAKLSSFDLKITWASGPAAVSGSGGTLTFSTEPTIKVSSLESFFTDPNLNPKGSLHRQWQINCGNVTAQNGYIVDLPVSDLYRGFLINSKASAVDVDYISRLQVVSGSTVFVDFDSETLQSISTQRLGMNHRADVPATGACVNQDIFVSPDSSIDGWYFLDLVTDGMLTEGINAIGMSELLLKLDVSSAADIIVIPIGIQPLRGG